MTAAKCQCVRCGTCGGLGQVEFDTHSYPEWDLETCMDCEGSGLSEICERCRDLEDAEDY